MGSNYMMSSMEEGSSRGSSSGLSADSLNGLKFGQKIYFEDHVVVGVGDTSAGKSSKNNNDTTKNNNNNNIGNKNSNNNGKGVVVQNGQGQQPPRCQVEGCKMDLSDAKAYYSRHKVCGMHSKSPVVIVAGLHQRFCQQCSRFHQLPEFDQGKRSCRRRLAGHNERRRKPPPGSLLSSRLGRLSSSLFGDNTSRSGGYLLDFSSYARQPERELWPGSKTSERITGSHSTSPEKFQHNLWPGNSEDHPPEMYLQGSAGRASFPIPSGECHTGVSTDSSCALSLLSNQTWGSRNGASGTGLGNLMNDGGAPMSQCAVTETVTVAHYPSSNSSWNFKGNEVDVGLHAATSDHMGLGQVSQPLNGQFHNDVFMDQIHGSGRHYMEVDHSRSYSSAAANHVNWSL